MITHKRLCEIFEYDAETGIAIWKVSVGSARPGDRVGSIYTGKKGKPYRYCHLKEGWQGKKPFSHVAFFYMAGYWPSEEVDHENGDSLDDRWENLREATRAQNEANRGARKTNKLGVKGVRMTKEGRYTTEIYRRGVHKYLGTFATLEEARAAYLAEAAKYDGSFLRAA